MRPLDLQLIGNELAIKWPDGTESYVAFEKLRRHCPCAGCQGERDILGNLYKGTTAELIPQSFQLIRVQPVGGYGIQPLWGDGHSTGIYSFDYLRRLAEEPAEGQGLPPKLT